MRFYLKALLPVLFSTFFLIPAVYAQQIPTGVAISLNDLLSIPENIGGFLVVLGEILAGIAIVWAGIVYMTSGSDSTRVKTAKDILKVGLIGALIIFGAGGIINTIRALATNPLNFFK